MRLDVGRVSGRGLTRREALLRGAAAGAGALALSAAGCGAARRLDSRALEAAGADRGPGRRLPLIFDMVLDTPGLAPARSAFRDPRTVAALGYDGQVIANWRPPTTAITFESFERGVLPQGSSARAWVERNARAIDAQTAATHGAGLKVLYHTDMVVLPSALIDRHRSQLVDRDGNLSLERSLTRLLVRVALREAFERFPLLDGLVIRTGEVYLQDLPFHSGGDPITRGPESHAQLLAILREEACERGKLILYRTWAFDGFTTSRRYYETVAGRIAPHPLLAFSIKHTDGDFWRTVAFNPTLGAGEHQQVVEVECQREYEGKGAHPNYIANGVIDGFEELRGSPPPIGLADLAGERTFAGVLTWSRGGGWNGPYIEDELWCELNAYAISRWAQNKGPSEAAVFDDYARSRGLTPAQGKLLRRLALLSAAAVLHGHYCTVAPLRALAWTRDEYLGGSDLDLAADFRAMVGEGAVGAVLAEKAHAVALWQQLVGLASSIALPDARATEHLRAATRYGALLHSIIANGWAVMLRGVEGERRGAFDREAMRASLSAYDGAWKAFRALPRQAPGTATLYTPHSFRAAASPRLDPTADPDHGMGPAIDRYRALLARIPAARVASPAGRAAGPSRARQAATGDARTLGAALRVV